MKTCLRILQILVSFFLFLIGLSIEAACQLTYTRNPSDLDAPKMLGLLFIVASLALTTGKELKE